MVADEHLVFVPSVQNPIVPCTCCNRSSERQEYHLHSVHKMVQKVARRCTPLVVTQPKGGRGNLGSDAKRMSPSCGESVAEGAWGYLVTEGKSRMWGQL